MRTYNRHFKELFRKGVDEEGFQEVKGRKFRVVESWLRGALKKLASNRPVAQLSTISLREISTAERSALHKHWIEQRSAQLTNDLIHALDSYCGSRSALDRCHSELDLRCVENAPYHVTWELRISLVCHFATSASPSLRLRRY